MLIQRVAVIFSSGAAFGMVWRYMHAAHPMQIQGPWEYTHSLLA